jgi:hypothetical protein
MRISLRLPIEDLETTLATLQTLRQLADRAAEKSPDHAGNARWRRQAADLGEACYLVNAELECRLQEDALREFGR